MISFYLLLGAGRRSIPCQRMSTGCSIFKPIKVWNQLGLVDLNLKQIILYIFKIGLLCHCRKSIEIIKTVFQHCPITYLGPYSLSSHLSIISALMLQESPLSFWYRSPWLYSSRISPFSSTSGRLIYKKMNGVPLLPHS